MQKDWILRLLARIGGPQRPGESLAQWKFRVATDSDVHPDCVHAAYYGRYVSKNHIQKFEQAAKNASHTDSACAFAEYYVQHWQDDPEIYGEEIDAAREFIGRIRRSDDLRRQYREACAEFDLPARRQDSGEE